MVTARPAACRPAPIRSAIPRVEPNRLAWTIRTLAVMTASLSVRCRDDRLGQQPTDVVGLLERHRMGGAVPRHEVLGGRVEAGVPLEHQVAPAVRLGRAVEDPDRDLEPWRV